ncbi:MAG: Mov34/MPN/PAD-1 family protein [Thermoplasmata archaeon]
MSLFDSIFGKKKKKDSKNKEKKDEKKDKAKIRKVWGIDHELLQSLFEISKETHPNEFAAVLRYDKARGVINEFMPLPGTLSGETSATLRLDMLPIDYSVVGVVHSHPTPYGFFPSGEDLFLFEKFGHTHIIIAYPYNISSWKAYDFAGNMIELEVVY